MNTQQKTEERPILFSAALVRSILAGDKTETRRPVKLKRSSDCTDLPDSLLADHIAEWRFQDGRWFGLDGYTTVAWSGCRYGLPGDRLWVRESCSFSIDGRPVCNLKPSDICSIDSKVWYAADMNRPTWAETKWTPSIHMPRWASRINLGVTGGGIERLQAMDGRAAIAEGVKDLGKFAELWDKINGDGAWSKNPWVRVVKFRLLASQQHQRKLFPSEAAS